MIKVRVNMTVQDYYTYVGTNPHYSLTKRVLTSIPDEVSKGYNLKFKRLKGYGNYYRVHISVKVDNISVISGLTDRYKGFMHRPENVSWKVIKISH